MNSQSIIILSVLYLFLLFAIAYYAEYRKKLGKSLINNSVVYALSLTVYCTAWTYYGSVGRATTHGLEFLAIYMGPTLGALLFWPILRKIIRITKVQRINSLADFISTRYGKNISLGTIVTILCMFAVIPYIALQLKAISVTFNMVSGNEVRNSMFFFDNTFYIAIILAIFIILFGTRSVDATEKHEGLVAAIAFESVLKIVAFICAGIFVTYGIFNGFGDIFRQSAQKTELMNLFSLGKGNSYISWFSIMLISMMAILFLPRQFQVSVIENVSEKHLKKASWIFPLYLLVINIFVFPIALGGLLIFQGQPVDADMYVLALPMHFGKDFLSLFIFIGGFSAATSMIIVETIAISTMFSNNLVMPLILSRKKFKSDNEGSISKKIIAIRRMSIVLIITLAYFYDKNIAHHFSLVSIGLISFTAVTQFAPAVLGGIFWKGASKKGALTGIIIGFVIWFYTLIIPSMASAHLINESIISNGLFGMEWLKPTALFGLEGFDSIAHSLFWSMFFNLFSFILISINSKLSTQEVYQAEIFVDVYKFSSNEESNVLWRGTAYLPDLTSLLENFLGKERATTLLTNYAVRNKIQMENGRNVDPRIVSFSERILAGVIGSASARIMVSSVTKEEELSIEEVLKILHESQQLIELNKEMRKKSQELSKATEQLKKANEQLRSIDEMKDEFLYTVTHELRTPLTSVRSLAEIIQDNPDLEEEQRKHFISAMVKEAERMSHLITQVLNLERYESGRQKLNLNTFTAVDLVNEIIESLDPLSRVKRIDIRFQHPDSMMLIYADRDLLSQVLVNLISNAIKFTPENGIIIVKLTEFQNELQFSITDSGKGIENDLHTLIFDKFFQARNQTLKKPEGSGLGLAICKKIVEMHGGRIWVESESGKGAVFNFTIPNFEPSQELIEHNESSI